MQKTGDTKREEVSEVMNKNKQQARAIKTQQAILKAAGELFSSRGFNTVTMREIAVKAGCSHTTIYLYYQNKMSLLQELAVEPLTSLLERFQAIKEEQETDPLSYIKNVSLEFITFAFEHRNMYDLFLTTEGERVDTEKPEHKLNRIRIQLFAILQSAIHENVPNLKEEQALQHTRMLFYFLHGMVKTYLDNEESTNGMPARLPAILHEAIEVMLIGIRERHK
jgi:AcrR family transcriptional regulator